MESSMENIVIFENKLFKVQRTFHGKLQSFKLQGEIFYINILHETCTMKMLRTPETAIKSFDT